MPALRYDIPLNVTAVHESPTNAISPLRSDCRTTVELRRSLRDALWNVLPFIFNLFCDRLSMSTVEDWCAQAEHLKERY